MPLSLVESDLLGQSHQCHSSDKAKAKAAKKAEKEAAKEARKAETAARVVRTNSECE